MSETATSPAGDPRRGIPSASQMERLRLCPVSYRRTIDGLMDGSIKPDDNSSIAAFGTDVHSLVELKIKGGKFLSPEKWSSTPEFIETTDFKDSGVHEASDRISELAERMVAAAKEHAEILIGEPLSKYRTARFTEQRLWADITDSDIAHGHFNPRFSGQADLIDIYATESGSSKIGIIIDYKSGWANQVPPADNLQLRTLAVLLYQRFKPKHIIVGIAQPNTNAKNLAHYTELYLEAASKQIYHIATQAENIASKLAPNEIPSGYVTIRACKYCPARRTCMDVKGLFNEIAAKGMAALSGMDIARQLDIASVVENHIAELKDTAKQMLKANPHSIPGYALTPGKNIRRLNASQAITSLVGDKTGLTATDIMEASTVSEQKVIKQISQTLGVSLAEARKLEKQMTASFPYTEGEPILTKL